MDKPINLILDPHQRARLRDEFALAILQAQMTARPDAAGSDFRSRVNLARSVYEMAEAMLRGREAD